MLKDKVLLITGGTGSFGNAIAERMLHAGVKELRIFSRDEKKQDDMRKKYVDSRIKYYIGDVRDQNAVDRAIRGVDFIFHAAALKQVPSCEFFPSEAVKTNVQGTENVLRSATQQGVAKVVVLSTDKAVYPINAMGISKALMEKVAISYALRGESSTTICVTRYGNVMGSRGSVIPLFINQILNKEKLTLTDGSMTRFLMSLKDAADLVLHAFVNGNNGEIFVHKAPSSRIDVLAQAVCEIYNYSFEKNVATIGSRHGEKMFEVLVSKEEMIKAYDEGEYYRIPPDVRNLQYNSYVTEGKESDNMRMEFNSSNGELLGCQEVVELIKKAKIC